MRDPLAFDPLAFWWKVPIASVRRKTGQGPRGTTYADPDTELKGRVNASNRLIRDVDGTETVSATRISLPIGTPLIPAGSLVQVRAGEDPRRVIAENRHESGTGVTPDYYSIDLD